MCKLSFFRLQKPLRSNTVYLCVLMARSQKNNMGFSRRLGKQKSLCVRHTLAGMGMYWRLWSWVAHGPVHRYQLTVTSRQLPCKMQAPHHRGIRQEVMDDLGPPSVSPPKSALWEGYRGWVNGMSLMKGKEDYDLFLLWLLGTITFYIFNFQRTRMQHLESTTPWHSSVSWVS